MEKIILGIDGMMCGMCEAHVNDAIRAAFNVKKVSSSHSRKQTEIVTETAISDDEIRDCIKKTGYNLTSIERKPYEKKGWFRR